MKNGEKNFMIGRKADMKTSRCDVFVIFYLVGCILEGFETCNENPVYVIHV